MLHNIRTKFGRSSPVFLTQSKNEHKTLKRVLPSSSSSYSYLSSSSSSSFSASYSFLPSIQCVSINKHFIKSAFYYAFPYCWCCCCCCCLALTIHIVRTFRKTFFLCRGLCVFLLHFFTTPHTMRIWVPFFRPACVDVAHLRRQISFKMYPEGSGSRRTEAGDRDDALLSSGRTRHLYFGRPFVSGMFCPVVHTCVRVGDFVIHDSRTISVVLMENSWLDACVCVCVSLYVCVRRNDNLFGPSPRTLLSFARRFFFPDRFVNFGVFGGLHSIADAAAARTKEKNGSLTNRRYQNRRSSAMEAHCQSNCGTCWRGVVEGRGGEWSWQLVFCASPSTSRADNRASRSNRKWKGKAFQCRVYDNGKSLRREKREGVGEKVRQKNSSEIRSPRSIHWWGILSSHGNHSSNIFIQIFRFARLPAIEWWNCAPHPRPPLTEGQEGEIIKLSTGSCCPRKHDFSLLFSEPILTAIGVSVCVWCVWIWSNFSWISKWERKLAVPAARPEYNENKRGAGLCCGFLAR